MSTYTGTFTVTNNTGQDISNLVASHTTSDYGTSSLGPQPLANGATTSPPVPFKSSTSQTDTWSVSFTCSDGQRTGSADCAFHDDDNGGNVSIILNLSNWSILMPAGHTCPDNDYDQT